MRVVGLVVIVVALAGCLESGVQQCANGTVCPAHQVCDDAHGGCVLPEQLSDCADAADETPCDAVLGGECFDEVCLTGGCGNDFLESDEVCDDDNVTDGDGCSAECDSDESCGNGIFDLVAGEQCDDGDLVSHDGCGSTCRSELPIWYPVRSGTPGARVDTLLAHDAARGETILFGGRDGNGYLGDTWRWDGRHWVERTPASSPPALSETAHTYDVARGKIVLFGGASGSAQADTWEWDGTSWTERLPSFRPTPRRDAAMAFDSARGVAVLFGGEGFVADDETTWEWDGDTWTAHPGNETIEPRVDHAMAYDPLRGKVVLYGGQTGTRDGSTWEWDGVAWTPRISTTSPGIRYGHAMVFDEVRGRIVLFGGQVEDGQLSNSLWTWDGNEWADVSPAGPAPPPRQGHAMTYDRARGVVIVHGGGDLPDVLYTDTWEWDGDAWTDVTPPPPTDLGIFVATYDSRRGRSVLVESFEVGTPLQTHVWEGGDRRSVASMAQISHRADSALAYDPVRDRVVMFGGGSSVTDFHDETWLWDGTDEAGWTLASPAEAPPARLGASMVYDAARDRILMFGGVAGFTLLDDTWAWDGTTWTEVTPLESPEARTAAVMAYDPVRERVVLFGGRSRKVLHGDTWEWDGSTWTQMFSPIAPTPRDQHGMAYHVGIRRMVLVGGNDGSGIQNDTWTWDGADWTLIDAARSPDPMDHAVLLEDPPRDQLVRFTPTDGPLLPTWVFRFDGDRPGEACGAARDLDGDELAGCADVDCAPLCDGCGDTSCSPLESCRICPADCGACDASCGDFYCDAPETSASCPGDCVP